MKARTDGISRRPENEADRKTLLEELKKLYVEDKLPLHEYEAHRKTVTTKMTQAQITVAAQQISICVAIGTAIASSMTTLATSTNSDSQAIDGHDTQDTNNDDRQQGPENFENDYQDRQGNYLVAGEQSTGYSNQPVYNPTVEQTQQDVELLQAEEDAYQFDHVDGGDEDGCFDDC